MSFNIIEWAPLFEWQFRFNLWSRWLDNLTIQFACRDSTSHSWPSRRVQCPDTRGNILHLLLRFNRNSQIAKIGPRGILYSAATAQTINSFQNDSDQSDDQELFENLPTRLPIGHLIWVIMTHQMTKFIRFMQFHFGWMFLVGFTGRPVRPVYPVYLCKRLWSDKLWFSIYIW